MTLQLSHLLTVPEHVQVIPTLPPCAPYMDLLEDLRDTQIQGSKRLVEIVRDECEQPDLAAGVPDIAQELSKIGRHLDEMERELWEEVPLDHFEAGIWIWPPPESQRLEVPQAGSHACIRGPGWRPKRSAFDLDEMAKIGADSARLSHSVRKCLDVPYAADAEERWDALKPVLRAFTALLKRSIDLCISHLGRNDAEKALWEDALNDHQNKWQTVPFVPPYLRQGENYFPPILDPDASINKVCDAPFERLIAAGAMRSSCASLSSSDDSR